MFINYEHNNHVYGVGVERRDNHFFITYDNNEYTVTADEQKSGQLTIQIGEKVIKCIISEGEDSKYVFLDGDIFQVNRIELTGTKKTKQKKEGSLNSPISGKVVAVKVKENAKVKKDDVIMVIEAMKMEYLIRAPYNGIIQKVHFKENDQIEIGEITADIEKSGGS